jgi:hypothetical protein
MSRIRLACMAAACFWMAACSTTIHTNQYPAIAPEKSILGMDLQQLSWWQLRFKLNWPADESPDFSGHLLLAEQILLPVLLEHEEQLRLWRFHRRAGRDAAGHQFSLIFFTGKETAERIGREVNKNGLTVWLQEESMLEQTKLDPRGPDELGQLEGTSDQGWPVEIQRSWPWFIMGASQAWLMQVQQISLEKDLAESMGYGELVEHYRKVAVSMNAQWRDYARHAYFHHLSALYGYQPVKIESTELQHF